MATVLKCGDRSLDLSAPRVMGILNVTPDSFSDGGLFASRDTALKHAEQMLSDGASILDVGGESTRPGANPVTVDDELDRVVPIVEAIASRFDVCISVDTSSPEVMLESAAAGAHLINDVRALERDGALSAAAATGLPVCLMHMQGAPQSMQDNPAYDDVLKDVISYLTKRIDVAEKSGIAKHRLLVDPGFGFGKTHQHNFRLLKCLSRISDLGLPVLAGLSRKRMIGEATKVELPAERVSGSVAGAVICAMHGASIIRVHDVRETSQALAVVQSMMES